MNIVKSLALAAVVAAASVPAANAAVVYATSVDVYAPVGTIRPDRSVQANALGAPDGDMLSLGLGGTAILSFGRSFTGPGTVFEVTNANRVTGLLPYLEEVEVYLGKGNVFTYLTNVTNYSAVTGAVIGFAGSFDQIKLIDVSPNGGNRDGFDIDAISVSTVPVPAAGLLLLTAIGAIGALRRRIAA